MSEIDARAIIPPATRLGRCVRVSAYAVVGNEVELGDGCVLHPHAVVNGPARLGRENVLHPFCSVGGDPQDLKYGGERPGVGGGDRNTLRADVTVSRGPREGGGGTRYWGGNLFIGYAPIAHRCQLGSDTPVS